MLDIINPLIITSITPLLGLSYLLTIPKTSVHKCRMVALYTSCLTFLFCGLILLTTLWPKLLHQLYVNN